LKFLRFDVCVFSSIISFLALPAMGQTQQTPQSQPPAASTQPAPAQGQNAVPDYPDPRTLTIGAFYWIPAPGKEPSYYGGSQAPDYETLTNWGKPHNIPGIEVIFPITRTGELHFEYFRGKGDGNQTTSVANLDVFGAGYVEGNYLATQYQFQSAKLYLDDLLFPHKFPVAKFRLKSLWEVEWVQIKGTIDAPYVDATLASEDLAADSANASRNIVLPTFGLAAEYALSQHVLLRASIAGFGIPHHSDLADAEATISYRHGMWEIRGGGKALHFKSSPNSDEYVAATLVGAFIGVRWHWSL
jgi:hypothetical protein